MLQESFISFHLPHLLLQSPLNSEQVSYAIDRKILQDFGPKQEPKAEEHQLCLYKASSSVLLTLVVPQEQPSREEELSLLTSPDALWNVIIVNGSWRMAMSSSREPVEYQTPLTQFIRGICGAVVSQKTNMIPILHELKKRLRASENNSLFDDRLFSKSRMYHWIIKLVMTSALRFRQSEISAEF